MNQPQQIETESMDSAALNGVRIANSTVLSSPDIITGELPVTLEAEATVKAARQAVEAIIRGEDSRLLVIVGPCSIHDPKAGLEYASRLLKLRKRYADKLEIVMRVYFEKPRTTVGWKGLMNTPDLTGQANPEKGLRMARELLIAINHMGVPAASEFLESITPLYHSDLVTWGAIGARTIESQLHREMASGITPPVGFKNGTEGNVDVAINAMVAARSPHTFLGINRDGQVSVNSSYGHDCTQLILRGGSSGPNFGYSVVVPTSEKLQELGLSPGIVVDCSHENSGKDFRKQGEVLDSVLYMRDNFKEYAVSGVMIESHLNEGRQDVVEGKELEYGVSITDGCVGWEETERMLANAYEKA